MLLAGCPRVCPADAIDFKEPLLLLLRGAGYSAAQAGPCVSCQVTNKLSWMEKVHIALRYSSNQGGGSSGKVDAQEEKHPWWAWTRVTCLWELNPLALELAEKPLWRGLRFPQGPLWHREPGEISARSPAGEGIRNQCSVPWDALALESELGPRLLCLLPRPKAGGLRAVFLYCRLGGWLICAG